MATEPGTYCKRILTTLDYAFGHPHGVAIDDVMEINGVLRPAAGRYLRYLEKAGWLTSEWHDYRDGDVYHKRIAVKLWRVNPTKIAQISEATQPIRSAMRLVRGGH